MRILLIDSDWMFRECVKLTLERRGHHVTSCDSPASLSPNGETTFDVIIAEHCGIQFARNQRIRGIYTPVIIMTKEVGESQKENNDGAARQIIAKSNRPSDLFKAVAGLGIQL